MAQLAYNIGNSLIEAVNVLGSIFYGVILGVFLVAFYRRRTGGRAVFISAVIVEIGVIVLGVLGKRGLCRWVFCGSMSLGRWGWCC